MSLQQHAARKLIALATTAAFLFGATTATYAQAPDPAAAPPVAPATSPGPGVVLPGYPPPGYYPPGYVVPGYVPAYPMWVPPPEKVLLRHESKPRYGLVIAGAATFGAIYLITAASGGLANSIDCHDHHSSCGGNWPLFVPLIGPFIHLANINNSGDAWLFGPVLVLSGLAQVTGMVLLIAGAATRVNVPVYAPDRPRLSVTPYLSPTGGGMSALVRF
jgi:hypothetical protein